MEKGVLYSESWKTGKLKEIHFVDKRPQKQPDYIKHADYIRLKWLERPYFWWKGLSHDV